MVMQKSFKMARNPWLDEHSALLDYCDTAQAPCKDFYHIFATPKEIIFRFWKIVPPTRANSSAPPVEIRNSYDDFLHDEKCHSEIQRMCGDATLQYLIRFAEGYMDYLPRLPDNVLKKIITKLDITDMVSLGATSHKFRQLCNRDDVWEAIFRREVETPVSAELETLALQVGWKRLFFTNKLQLQMHLRRQKRTDHAFVTEGQQMEDDMQPMQQTSS